MDRRAILAAVVLLVIHASAAWLARPPGIATRQDDAAYLLLAESIAQGGYNELYRADSPTHHQYPPVYPVMLALWRTLFGSGYDTTVLLTVAASVGALGSMFVVLGRIFGPLVALTSLALLAVNPLLVQYGGSIATETPFGLFAATTLALLAVSDPSPGRAALAAVLAVCAVMTRIAGIPLAVAVALLWLLQRRWRQAVLFAGFSVLVIGGWLLWAASAPEQFVGRSYVADFTSAGAWQAGPQAVLNRLLRKIPLYVGQFLPWVLPAPTIAGTPVDNAVSSGVIAATLLTGWIVIMKRWLAAGLFLLAYAGMLIFWPFSHERFLVPVLIVVIPTVIAGAAWLGRRAGPRTETIAVIGLALIIGGTALPRSATLVSERLACDRSGLYPPKECVLRDVDSFFDAVGFIESRTPPDAVFLTMKPEPLYLYTRRITVGAREAVARTPDDFVPNLRAQGVRYVLLGSIQAREPAELAELMAANCEAFDHVAFFPARTYLFELRPAGVTGPTRACESIEHYRTANRDRDFQRDP
ncbi:MAG: glycosyltransferase family 39 protein [Gemmatimonadetes bacterium]|nr:glycosyltransferase family 39 protein [Gemmatimonadota bacterium]